MVDENALNRETFDWKQSRLEEGKFPCKCGHFESSHVKRMCIACHGTEMDHPSTVHGEGYAGNTCWHQFEQMDNLTVVEWMAAHKKDI